MRLRAVHLAESLNQPFLKTCNYAFSHPFSHPIHIQFGFEQINNKLLKITYEWFSKYSKTLR